MTDWQVGDLALCVRAKYRKELIGKVGIVRCVVFGKCAETGEPALGLEVEGFPNPPSGWGWMASFFRKITPGADIEGIEAEKRISVPHLFPLSA